MKALVCDLDFDSDGDGSLMRKLNASVMLLETFLGITLHSLDNRRREGEKQKQVEAISVIRVEDSNAEYYHMIA